jgi:hypothetical protein
MANHFQVTAIATQVDADSPETVTVQLRKATDASGTNAADFGTAGTGTSSATDSNIHAVQTEWSDDLGFHASGLPFTHVSAVVSDDATPESDAYGVVVRSDPRYS